MGRRSPWPWTTLRSPWPSSRGSRIDSPPRRRPVARGGRRPDPWMDEGRGPRGRRRSRFGRTRLVPRPLEGAETGGTATDPSGTEFVEVATAAAAGDLEASLDEALADRATALEVRDDAFRLLLHELGDVDLGDHLLRVLFAVEGAVGDDLDREGHGPGGGHLEPQLDGFRAVGRHGGDIRQTLGLCVADNPNPDILSESLPDVLDAQGRIGPLIHARPADIAVRLHARRERLARL